MQILFEYIICADATNNKYIIFNLYGAETEIFWDHWVNTITADALAPCVARSSAIMVLTKHDKQVLTFHELTPCGLVTPYGDMELGQHRFR